MSLQLSLCFDRPAGATPALSPPAINKDELERLTRALIEFFDRANRPKPNKYQQFWQRNRYRAA